jgi:2-oxoglutarate dehydrogenase E2 component (dihydrolipoamide succinyltransferase)
VIRDAARRDAGALHAALLDFSMREAERKLSHEDLAEGTITATDLSSLNVLQHQPLLNRNQSVILGIGGDSSLPGRPLTLTMTYDHRVLTGREVAECLNRLKEGLLSSRF